jgi:hypothetical protein
MHRRTLLATAGLALTGLAGCTDDGDPGGDGTAPTGSPGTTTGVAMDEAVTLGDRRVAVANPRVERAVVVQGTAHSDVHMPTDAHYLVVDVAATRTQAGADDRYPAATETPTPRERTTAAGTERTTTPVTDDRTPTTSGHPVTDTGTSHPHERTTTGDWSDAGETTGPEGDPATTTGTPTSHHVDYFSTTDETAAVHPANLDLALALDDEATADDPLVRLRGPTAERGQAVAFPVPLDAAPDEATVTWAAGDRSATWPIPEDVVARLGGHADFAVRSVAVPEGPVQPGATVDVTVTVANEGDRDGTFRYELGDGGVSDHPEFALTVAAGGTASRTHSLTVRDFDGRQTFPVVCDWGADRVTPEVPVAD